MLVQTSLITDTQDMNQGSEGTSGLLIYAHTRGLCGHGPERECLPSEQEAVSGSTLSMGNSGEGVLKWDGASTQAFLPKAWLPQWQHQGHPEAYS